MVDPAKRAAQIARLDAILDDVLARTRASEGAQAAVLVVFTADDAIVAVRADQTDLAPVMALALIHLGQRMLERGTGAGGPNG